MRKILGILLAVCIVGVMALTTAPKAITPNEPPAPTAQPSAASPQPPSPGPQILTASPQPLTPTPLLPTSTPLTPTPTLTPVCATPNGSLVTETVPDTLLANAFKAQVFLPPCYIPGKSYPLLILIHGTAQPFGGWVNKQKIDAVAAKAMTSGKLPALIIVMPSSDVNMGQRSVYAWSDGGKNSYEDVIVNELLPFIESKYSVINTQQGRAIGGISRGGYWALEIAFSHPELFGAVGAHSPSTYSQLVGLPKSFSVLQYAKSLNDLRAMRIWLDAGESDWALADAKRLAAELKAKDIPYELSTTRGAHGDALWASRALDYLQFYAREWVGISPHSR